MCGTASIIHLLLLLEVVKPCIHPTTLVLQASQLMSGLWEWPGACSTVDSSERWPCCIAKVLFALLSGTLPFSAKTERAPRFIPVPSDITKGLTGVPLFQDAAIRPDSTRHIFLSGLLGQGAWIWMGWGTSAEFVPRVLCICAFL